jgi:hypothetical protein
VPSAKRPEKRPEWPQDLTLNVVPEGSFDIIREASVHLLNWTSGESRLCVLIHDIHFVDEDTVSDLCAISNTRDGKVLPENECRPIRGGKCENFPGTTPALAWVASSRDDGWRVMAGERLMVRVTGAFSPADQVYLRYSGWRLPMTCWPEWSAGGGHGGAG